VQSGTARVRVQTSAAARWTTFGIFLAAPLIGLNGAAAVSSDASPLAVSSEMRDGEARDRERAPSALIAVSRSNTLTTVE
jgi:hypothetical protein